VKRFITINPRRPWSARRQHIHQEIAWPPFFSYRRTNSPQACRVHDWLARRFGQDEVFMDVSAIPAAVDFSDFINQAITGSRLMIVLIGPGWVKRVQDADDPVRREIQAALAQHVPLLPVLIGTTPMPDPDELPAAIAAIAMQNAATVGVSRDFDAHMQALLPRIESMLRQMARHGRALDDPDVIYQACVSLVHHLKDRYLLEQSLESLVEWRIVGTSDFLQLNKLCVALFMHRVVRLGSLLELHFILSIWGHNAAMEHRLAGWVMRELEQTPILPVDSMESTPKGIDWDLKIRRSDEDPRQIWQLITDEPLRLSLAYVATIVPRADDPVDPVAPQSVEGGR
jgi:hypothetical protein